MHLTSTPVAEILTSTASPPTGDKRAPVIDGTKAAGLRAERRFSTPVAGTPSGWLLAFIFFGSELDYDSLHPGAQLGLGMRIHKLAGERVRP
jgi:hypothetical protein